jgi:hypothetical protein
MKLQICLKMLSIATISLGLGISVAMGALQQLIPFESVLAEMSLALIAFTFGFISLALTFSIKKG